MANLVQRWFKQAADPEPIPERKAIEANAFLQQFLPAGFFDDGSAGIAPDAAMRCTTVRACVACIADSLAALPLHLYRRLSDGSKERATDHPLYSLLHDAPNDWTSAFEFRRAMQADLLLHGQAFAFINRVNGAIVEVIRLAPTAVEPDFDLRSGEPVTYRVTTPSGTQERHPRRDVLHLRGLSNPIKDAAKAIRLSLLLEQHGSRLFANGAKPGGVLETPNTLSDEAIERIRASFESSYAGEANSGRTLVLEEGLVWHQQTMLSTDAQFLELRKFQVQEIARAFRMPLHKIGDLERMTFNNVESMALDFLQATMLPWLKLWEGAIARSLLSPDERRDFFAEFLVDDLLRGDIRSRYEAFSTAVLNGYMTINEVRAAENRPPIAGGDTARAPLNQSPIDAPMDGPPQ